MICTMHIDQPVEVCKDHYVDIEQVCQKPDVEVGSPPCRASSAGLRFDVALGILQPEVVSCVTVCVRDSVHTPHLALHVVGVTTEVGQSVVLVRWPRGCLPCR